jgi:flagellar protein FliO/FliZ
MKHGPTLSLILAAVIAALAVPATAQNAPAAGKPATTASASPAATGTTAAPATAAAPVPAVAPAATGIPAKAATPAPVASDVAGAPKPSAAEPAVTDPVTGAPASANTDTGAGAGTANGAPATAATATTTPPGPLAMTIPTPQPTSSATGGLLQTTFALLFVLALLLGGAWFVKRFGPKNFGGGNSPVKLVGSLSLGTRERILVVEVGDQWIVVGASPGRINQLATMPRQANADAAVPATLQTANFADWFKQTIDKRNGK